MLLAVLAMAMAASMCGRVTFAQTSPFWPAPTRISCRARGFGEPQAGNGMEDDMLKYFSEWCGDLVYEAATAARFEERQLDVGVATVKMVGGNHASRLAARAANDVISSFRPSALILELCPERFGEALIRGSTHRKERVAGLMEEELPPPLRRAYRFYGGEMRAAWKAFSKLVDGRLLVLGDLRDSTQERKEPELGDTMSPGMRAVRDANLARNILWAEKLGHKRIVAVVGTAHVPGVDAELRSYSSLSGMWPQGPVPEGFFISEKGMAKLQQRRTRLLRKVPAQRFTKGSKQSRLIVKRECNSQRIAADLEGRHLALQPKNWKELQNWWSGVTKNSLAPEL